MGIASTVLVISYQHEKDEVSMGHVVGTYSSRALAESFDNEEDAIHHVAILDATREVGSDEFSHFFIYPDGRFDPERDNCIPFSKVNLDQWDSNGGIPEHLQEMYKGALRFHKLRSKEFEKALELQRAKKSKEEDRQRDEIEFEYLKKKLGK